MPHETIQHETTREAERARPRVGDMLRSRRLSREEDLREVAQKLKIRYPYLEAIEEGRLNELPGPTYAVGFVRAYADYLGLATEDVVARFKADSRALENRAELVFPEPLPGSRVPGFALLLVAIILGGMVYGGWLFVSGQDRPIAEIIPAVPERLAQLIDDVSGARGGDGTGQQAPVSAPEPAPEPAPGPVAPAPVGPGAPAAEEAPRAADETAAPSGTVAPETSAPAQPGPQDGADTTDTVAAPAPQTAPQPAPQPAPQTADAAPAEVSSPAGSTTPAPPLRTEAEIAAEEAAEAAAPAAAPAGDQGVSSVPPVAEVTSVPLDAPQTGSSEGAPSETTSGESSTGDAPSPTPAALPEVPSDSGGAAEQVAASTPGSETVFGAESGQSRVSLTARVASWVEVTGPDGDTLMARLLRAGETYRVPDRQGIRLVTGNAGGLEILVDGTRAPDLGPLGAVRRNIALDPAKLKAGVAGER